MDILDFADKAVDVLANDKKLNNLLGIDNTASEELYALKYRRRDQSIEEFSPDDLDFIAFYFSDAQTTNNDYMNKGLLRVDIYTKLRYNAANIRRRIVELFHDNFDERVYAEGQKYSGVKDVYKYRLEFLPLVFN